LGPTSVSFHTMWAQSAWGVDRGATPYRGWGVWGGGGGPGIITGKVWAWVF